MWKVIKLCFSGLYALLQDSAGSLSLITLFGILVVTAFRPMIGGIALAAYATAVPGILAWTAHKISLAQIAQGQFLTNDVSQDDLPKRGQS